MAACFWTTVLFMARDARFSFAVCAWGKIVSNCGEKLPGKWDVVTNV